MNVTIAYLFDMSILFVPDDENSIEYKPYYTQTVRICIVYAFLLVHKLQTPYKHISINQIDV